MTASSPLSRSHDAAMAARAIAEIYLLIAAGHLRDIIDASSLWSSLLPRYSSVDSYDVYRLIAPISMRHTPTMMVTFADAARRRCRHDWIFREALHTLHAFAI